jgi:predicted glycoside hydrolase/deacetylase ChbG (UPF0249 family)
MKTHKQVLKQKRIKRIFDSLSSTGTSDIVLRLLTKGICPPPEAIQNPGKKYLIINGDDLCRDDKTDEAILSAFRNGVLTSTSAFINYPGSAQRLMELHSKNPDLPIGLHLNLTDGEPVEDSKEIKGLTDKNGRFYRIETILQHLHQLPLNNVRKELQAQIELFLSTGVPLDHLDYHFHLVASYTPFYKLVRELALEYNVPVRNPVPFSIYNLIKISSNGGGSRNGIRKLILFGLSHPFKSIPLVRKVGPGAFSEQKSLMLAEGIQSTDWFIDNFFDNASPEIFVSILEQLPGGISEIACHPGREKELEVLTSGPVKEAIKILNIKLISYNDINPVQQQARTTPV